MPNTNGLEARVVDNKIEITGTPENIGDYTVNIKIISDDERDVSIEKTVPLKINDKLSLTLEGSFRCCNCWTNRISMLFNSLCNRRN